MILEKNIKGRRKTNATPVLVRIHPQLLEALDRYIGVIDASRPDAIRFLLMSHPALAEHIEQIPSFAQRSAGPNAEMVKMREEYVAIRKERDERIKT